MNKNDPKRNRSKKGLINPNYTKTFVVYEDTTLLEFLKKKIPAQSEKNVKRIIMNHQVAVGGVPTDFFHFPLYKEDEVTLSWTPIKNHIPRPIPILFEDDDIIAIDKPSGLLSVASDREKGRTAYRMVSEYIASKRKGARIFVVHRLDEDTSGVLIFAKNIETRLALQKDWGKVVSLRRYFAIVEPGNIEKEKVLKDYLAQDSTQKVYVTPIKSKGKLAVTHYKVIASNAKYALLDVDISTGRKNQIRVQLGHTGHYVIGDDKYGEPSNPLKRLGLHASQLTFVNPLTRISYDISSPLPKPFKSLFWKSHQEVKKEKEEKSRREKSFPSRKRKKR